MKVKVRYPGAIVPGRESWTYTFEAPDDTEVGDRFRDGTQEVVVVELGSEYDGPVRELERR